jgi:endonuclease/exonuclease/phosphatase family metal-dependent hydrolase
MNRRPTKSPPKRGIVTVTAALTLLVTTSFGDIVTTDIRIVAANITSGSYQQYNTPGINIFKGLQPDIVAIQEFNYGNNSNEYARVLVDEAFGPQFHYYREPYRGFYPIPNGVISRWPILDAGYWVDADPGINQRGFVWSKIDIPGTNDLYVVSVHLKAGSSDASRRAAQSDQLKSLIISNFPPNSLFVIAGDFNIHSAAEYALTNFFTIASDYPIPTDGNGNPNTNAGRNNRYDYILTSFSMTSLLITVTMPSQSYSNGLVFDSRVYQPLSDVPPVQHSDSGVAGMQHMAVVRDYRILHEPETNLLGVVAPVIVDNPIDIIGSQNDTGRLSVAASGNGNLVFRWRKDGQYLPGATNDTVDFGSLQPSNIAPYQAVVANEIGIATSDVAWVRLHIPEPTLSVDTSGGFAWSGISNLPYTVQMSTDLMLSSWTNLSTISSTSSAYLFTNAPGNEVQYFFRVTYP